MRVYTSSPCVFMHVFNKSTRLTADNYSYSSRDKVWILNTEYEGNSFNLLMTYRNLKSGYERQRILIHQVFTEPLFCFAVTESVIWVIKTTSKTISSTRCKECTMALLVHERPFTNCIYSSA